MASYSKTILVGNVGQDPDIRKLPGGDTVANFTLATSEKWKDKQTGQQQERTEWHKCVIYGKLADVVAQYVKKGSCILVEGQNATRSYDKDGQKLYVTEVKCHTMQMMGSRPDSGAQNAGQAPQAQQRSAAAPQQRPQQAPAGGFDDSDLDIPF